MSNVTHLRERQERKGLQSLRKRTQAIGDALDTGRVSGTLPQKGGYTTRTTRGDPQPPREPSFLDDCIIRVTFWDGLIAGLAIGLALAAAIANSR